MAEKLMTKAEESAILDQIENLINSTEGGSYIRMAFAGCVRMARENIEYDFANSYPELLEFKDKQIEEIIMENSKKEKEVAERLRKLEHENNVYEQKIEELENRISTLVHLNESKDKQLSECRRDAEGWENNAHDAGELYCELEKECVEKDMEIQRLKAELYDYMKGAKNNA